jgi:hypothetical protein
MQEKDKESRFEEVNHTVEIIWEGQTSFEAIKAQFY